MAETSQSKMFTKFSLRQSQNIKHCPEEALQFRKSEGAENQVLEQAILKA